jgi:hypothetical protein
MRASILLLPIALSTLASMPIAAQEAPRVIFCAGQCTAVDEKGVRTPALKGTVLRENQRLETGPGAYAQLKVGRDVALGVGEGAQIRFDQKSVRGGDVVFLDQGRIRMLDGTAFGKPAARTLELRTTDGRFALQGADIEVKTPPHGRGSDSNTFVKLNVGDARFLNPQGGVAITTDSVQAFTGGKAITDKSVSLADVAMTPTRTTTPTAPAIEPVANLAPTPLPVQPPMLRPDPLGPISNFKPAPIAPALSPVSSPDRFLKPLTTLVTLPPLDTTGILAPAPIKQQLILSPVGTTPTLTRTTVPIKMP